jgi:transcriptional regulator with XRE-family HTH domain
MTNSGETENFGKLLRMMMVHANVTQADLARHMGVRRPTVTDWVNGTHLPRYRDLILQMAQFLGASEEQTQQLLAAAVMPHLWPEGVASAHKVTISQLRQEYVERVAVFSQAIPLAWGQAGDMRQAYVHARLEPVEAAAWPPQDRAISANTVEKSQLADSLLLATSCHAAILAPAGSGKSILWRWLIKRVAQGAAGDLIPIPLDWAWVRAGDPGDVISLLEMVINRIGLDHNGPSTTSLAKDLLAQLETGAAVALIDNWSGFEGGITFLV